jgi:zinc-ribbon domain
VRSISSSVRMPPVTATLGCAKCGAPLVEGAQFCSNCGKPVSIAAKKTPAQEFAGIVDAIPQLPARRHHVGRKGLWVLLALFVAGIVWTAVSDNPFAQGIQEVVGWKHDQSILENPFSVSAHSFRYYKFALPEGSMNVSVVGQFTAAADKRNTNVKDKDKDKDSDNDIEVYVLSEPAFTVWQNGYATSSVYNSGRVSEGSLESDLPAGAGIYYLVFNNRFAPKTAKTVNATVLLRYKSWLPESFRRAKDHFWNWLAL